MKKFSKIIAEVQKGQSLSIDIDDIKPSKAAIASAKKAQKLIDKGMGTAEAIDAILRPIVKGVKTYKFNSPRGESKHKKDMLRALGIKYSEWRAFGESVNEARTPDKNSVKKALDDAGIQYKSIKNPERGEFEIVSGITNKSGKKWDTYEDSVYKALKKGGVDLSGDASVFIN